MTAQGELSNLIRRYVERGEEKLMDAERKLLEGRFASVMEYAYDAMEYWAVACLAKAIMAKRLDHTLPRTHGGTVSLFGKVFVESGIVDEGLGRALAKMLPKRQRVRYGIWTPTREEAEKALGSAKGFVERARRLIEEL